jgi:hypothetical protein
MPQLDKLTFTSQVFWFFLLFVFLYYSMLQMTLLRLKFILGLKRFFFQTDKNNSFFDLSKNLNFSSRQDLLFFFDFYFSKKENLSNFSFEFLRNNTSSSSLVSNLIENFVKFIENSFNVFNLFLNRIFKPSFDSFNYNFVLDLNKNLYLYSYNYIAKANSLDFKELYSLSNSISYFYEQFLNIFSFFFKAVQFYIYDTVFVLFFSFFNLFFRFKEILFFFKLLNRISI